MTETGYKQIHLGPKKVEIPTDWKARKLSEFASFKNGKAVDHSNNENKEFLVYGSNGPIGSYEDYNLERGLIIGRVGAVGEVHKTEKKAWVSDNAIIIEIDEKKADLDFIYNSLSRRNLKVLSTKTAQPLLNQSTVKTLKLPLPSLPEQRKIAEILSTVDEAIQQTDDVIETARELKKGLMQDLLTKGIRHDDFKRVRIGPKKIKLPNSWKIERIDKIFDIKAGGDSKDKECSDSRTEKHQYPVFANSLEDKGLYGYSKDFEYPGGCVTITGRGDLGHAEYRDKKFSAIVRLLVLIPQEEVDGEFVKYYINGEVFFPSESTGVPQLTRPEVAKTKIALPPLNEQKEIAEKLSVVDEKIRQEEKYKEKLEELKKGLMQDLLTGKVRVNNLVN